MTQQAGTNKGIVLTLANQKGGVTKTTTSINLAMMLTLMGCKVLMVDCDPQGNATFAYGYTRELLTRTLYSILLGQLSLKEAILPTYVHPVTNMFFDPQEKVDPQNPASETILQEVTRQQLPLMRGPDLLPINIQASRAENELRQRISGATALKRALQSARQVYDYIVCDTNPSLGILTINALCASDYVCIPLVPELLAVQGLRDLLSTIEEAQQEANPGLQIVGVIFTKVKNYRSHKDMIADLRRELPLKSFQTEIKESSTFLSAADRRSVIVLSEAYGEHAWAYWQLLAEVLNVIGGVGKTHIGQVLATLERERQKIAQEKRERREQKLKSEDVSLSQQTSS